MSTGRLIHARKLRRFTVSTTLLVGLLASIFSDGSAFAATPRDGYFTGIDMDPVASADIKAVEAEPSVALIFAVDQDTSDATHQFDAWHQSADRPQINVFVIGVVPEGISRDVALEAISQRDLHMPVFLAESDMLLGDKFRLVVLNQDAEIARFTTLDMAGVYDALKSIGVAVNAPPPAVLTPAPAPAPAPDPTTAPLPAASEAALISPTMPAATVTTTATTATAPADDSETLLLGGKGESGLYSNNRYGMRIQFPPDWQFRVAGKRDGAVAVPPRGSRLDLRMWALPADGLSSPQDYVDQRLESIAQTHKTRVHIERHVQVLRDGRDSVDVTYTYTRPLDEANPAKGGLIWRGRMLIFLENGTIKAAVANAPGGEFLAAFPLIDSFIHSFQILPNDNSPSAGYSIPDSI